jgi:saccharopine dehydrogenase-like NADP-dependent oxidoreductase
MQKVVVLGAGMVGSAMAVDLSGAFDVTAVDMDMNRLDALAAGHPGIQIMRADLSHARTVSRISADFDLVLGAVPGFMGLETLRAVIESGTNVVDISFFPEDPLQLDDLARRREVIAVVDCGVAPGMSNLILGHHSRRMKVDSFRCLVGGLPVRRTEPYQYKAPFSPIDVLEEYTRQARLVVDGRMVERPALSEPEPVEFAEVGTLVAFNTDGLRTLISTMDVPNMVEKTMRYPGHIEHIRLLRDSGFFSKEPVRVGEASIRPLDLTARILFPIWTFGEGEEDITVMTVEVSGEEEGTARTYRYSLFDRYDPETGTSSMARTTGYTCTAVARLVLDGLFGRHGVTPPEGLGAEEGIFEAVLNDLKAHNVEYRLEIDPA